MSRVFVHGWGAASPAGWGSEPLRAALSAGRPLPAGEVTTPAGRRLPVRRVPTATPRPAWLGQPRLRRCSLISQFAVGAALEALGDRSTDDLSGLGIICSVMGGGVIYSRRFFEEVLHDPPTASPLLFPETVFNAPASHLGAILGGTGRNDTLVGDQTGFLQALAMGAAWLTDGTVAACLVVGSEETDWLSAEAAALFHRGIPTAEGAGALLPRREPSSVELLGVTDPQPFFVGCSRAQAAARLAGQLGGSPSDSPLRELTLGRPAATGGAVTSVVPVLGDGLAAAGAWACVGAVQGVQRKALPRAGVRVLGANLQALGAVFGQAAA